MGCALASACIHSSGVARSRRSARSPGLHRNGDFARPDQAQHVQQGACAPSLASLTDTEVYIYYGNTGASEANDADTWSADYVVYHLKEDPAGTAPQGKDSTANAVHGTYDIAGAPVEDNMLWSGKCILFDDGPRLRVEDNPAIENADRITIETWVNTLSWPGRTVVCRKEGSYILYNYSGGFSWYLFGPDSRLQHDIAGTLGNGSWARVSRR